ncbi:MAG: hypothetical protein ACU0B1_15450 [Thermohalobaculum sp.]
MNLKIALLKALIILVPSYTAAYLTDKMVWVVPTLVASGFLAASIGLSSERLAQRVDENEDGDSGQEEDVGLEVGSSAS